MKITRYLLASGLAAVLGLGVACEKRTSDDMARTTATPAGSPSSPTANPPAPPSPSPKAPSDTATPSTEKQPVSGSSVFYVTDDGKRREITDTAALTQLQQKLQKEGLFSGSIDGHPSPELTSALRRYQARNGLSDTAVIDHATANKLGLDWDKLTKSNVRSEVEKGANKAKDEMKEAGDKIKDSANDVGKEIKKDVDKAKDDATK